MNPNQIDLNADGKFNKVGTFDIMDTFNSLIKFITYGAPIQYPILYATALQREYTDFNKNEHNIDNFFSKVRISICSCKYAYSRALYSLRFNYFLDLFISKLEPHNKDFFVCKITSLYILENVITEDLQPPPNTVETIPTNITIDTLTISQVGAFTESQDKDLMPDFQEFSSIARSTSTRNTNQTTNSMNTNSMNTNGKTWQNTTLGGY